MEIPRQETVTRVYCDNCGKELTYANRETVSGFDYCLRDFEDTNLRCSVIHKITLRAAEVKRKNLRQETTAMQKLDLEGEEEQMI